MAARGTRNQKARIKPRYPELLNVPRAILTPRIAPVSDLERDNGTSESSPPRKTRSEARRIENVPVAVSSYEGSAAGREVVSPDRHA